MVQVKSKAANERWFFEKLKSILPFMDYDQLCDTLAEYENSEQSNHLIKEIAHIRQAIRSFTSDKKPA